MSKLLEMENERIRLMRQERNGYAGQNSLAAELGGMSGKQTSNLTSQFNPDVEIRKNSDIPASVEELKKNLTRLDGQLREFEVATRPARRTVPETNPVGPSPDVESVTPLSDQIRWCAMRIAQLAALVDEMQSTLEL